MPETLFTSRGAIHNLMEAGLEIQGLEAKLQHYQQFDARVNDLYARMQRYAEDLTDAIDRRPDASVLTSIGLSELEELWDDKAWAEAWLEALEWIRGDRADPLMEGLTQPLP